MASCPPSRPTYPPQPCPPPLASQAFLPSAKLIYTSSPPPDAHHLHPQHPRACGWVETRLATSRPSDSTSASSTSASAFGFPFLAFPAFLSLNLAVVQAEHRRVKHALCTEKDAKHTAAVTGTPVTGTLAFPNLLTSDCLPSNQ
eukprot:363474-Chlamydomonas_euryale.AAC.7